MNLKAEHEVRILTIKSPYAELILNGKEIEVRKQMTNYRGWVLIHTGLVEYKWDEVKDIAGDKYFDRILDIYHNTPVFPVQPGKVIALARIIDSRPMRRMDESKSFVKHNLAFYSWALGDIQPVTPFSVRGRQGLIQVDDSIKNMIKII